jgi:type II secretory pathway pseudopilin PulG
MSTQTVVNKPTADGFTLIETVIALVVIMIAMLGALQAINYSILYNAGNSTRAVKLAILQQEVERLRAAKFTPTGVDAAPLPSGGTCRTDDQRDISAGAKAACTVTVSDGRNFRIRTWVDNNPFNGAGSPNDANPPEPPAANHARIKEITVEVELASPSPGWQTAIPARVVLRRTIGN